MHYTITTYLTFTLIFFYYFSQRALEQLENRSAALQDAEEDVENYVNRIRT